MSPPYFLAINTYVYNTGAAATFLSWDYCLTVGEETEYIWRRKWNPVTALFAIIRYISIIYTNLRMVNNIAPFVLTSHGTCAAWFVVGVICTAALIMCFEILLVMRVLALYGQNRLMRNGLITLLLCVNVIRIVLFAIAIPQYRFERYVYSNIHRECHMIEFPSFNPSGVYTVEIIPEAVLVCLAVIKLIQTKRKYNIAVSNLLVVIVRDGTWAFALIFAFIVWNILQYELASENGGIAVVWVAPAIGFTGSRLILNIRSEARTPPGGTNVEIIEISFPRIDDSASIHDPV